MMPNDEFDRTLKESPADHEFQNTVDRLADQFEKAWNSKQKISIESLMDSVGDAGKASVLQELLTVEFELIMKEGKRPDLEKYRKRFAKFPDILEHVYQTSINRYVLGNYELFDQIAKGGMGIIWRARHILLDKIVAVKIMPDSFLQDKNALSRFQREMKLVGSLDHPNIVRAFGAEKVGSSLILAMEYIDGRNLKQIVRSEGPLPYTRALQIVRKIALALQQAHERKIVHRDIKPENVMISADTEEIKVLDFGLGKFIDENIPCESRDNELTVIGSPIGTLDYLAPEQWESPGSVDIRADIYSLGCTLFFLLTGDAPYESLKSSSKREKMLAHLTRPFPRLREYGISVSGEVEKLLAKMTAKDRERRYADPVDLIRAIDDISSRTTEYGEHGEMLSRRTPVNRLVLGGVILVMMVGFILVFQRFFGHPAMREESTTAFLQNPVPDENPKRVVPTTPILAPDITRLRHVNLRTARRIARERHDDVEERIRLDKTPLETHPRKEEFVEACERLADCTLYHGHVLGEKYEFYREEAEDLYRQAAKWTDDPSRKEILQCKRILTNLISGDLDSGLKRLETLVADVARQREENSSRAANAGFNGESVSPTVFLEIVSGIADFYRANTTAEGRDTLRTVLNRFRLNADSAKRYHGERLDLQLFCIRLLLESSLAEDAKTEAKADVVQYLDPILLGTLASDAEMRPFLRDFYDLAIRCRDRDELLPLAEYIRCERMVAARTSEATHLIFYFDSRSGFLIILPKDRHMAKRFDLPYSRADIREATDHKKNHLTLPDEVVRRIEAEWEEHHPIDLSWSDRICYCSESEGLTPADWPFADQLDYERLCGIVK